jgi:hypothetical protein
MPRSPFFAHHSRFPAGGKSPEGLYSKWNISPFAFYRVNASKNASLYVQRIFSGLRPIHVACTSASIDTSFGTMTRIYCKKPIPTPIIPLEQRYRRRSKTMKRSPVSSPLMPTMSTTTSDRFCYWLMTLPSRSTCSTSKIGQCLRKKRPKSKNRRCPSCKRRVDCNSIFELARNLHCRSCVPDQPRELQEDVSRSM